MYSPKIQDALIPRIYRIARHAKIPMTRWVNQILEQALADQEASTDHTIVRHPVGRRKSPP